MRTNCQHGARCRIVSEGAGNGDRGSRSGPQRQAEDDDPAAGCGDARDRLRRVQRQCVAVDVEGAGRLAASVGVNVGHGADDRLTRLGGGLRIRARRHREGCGGAVAVSDNEVAGGGGAAAVAAGCQHIQVAVGLVGVLHCAQCAHRNGDRRRVRTQHVRRAEREGHAVVVNDRAQQVRRVCVAVAREPVRRVHRLIAVGEVSDDVDVAAQRQRRGAVHRGRRRIQLCRGKRRRIADGRQRVRRPVDGRRGLEDGQRGAAGRVVVVRHVGRHEAGVQRRVADRLDHARCRSVGEGAGNRRAVNIGRDEHDVAVARQSHADRAGRQRESVSVHAAGAGADAAVRDAVRCAKRHRLTRVALGIRPVAQRLRVRLRHAARVVDDKVVRAVALVVHHRADQRDAGVGGAGGRGRDCQSAAGLRVESVDRAKVVRQPVHLDVRAEISVVVVAAATVKAAAGVVARRRDAVDAVSHRHIGGADRLRVQLHRSQRSAVGNRSRRRPHDRHRAALLDRIAIAVDDRRERLHLRALRSGAGNIRRSVRRRLQRRKSREANRRARNLVQHSLHARARRRAE